MSFQRTRSRSSTPASAGQTAHPTSKALEMQRDLFDRLESELAEPRHAGGDERYPDMTTLTGTLRQIGRHLAASEPSPSPPQDDFQALRGFSHLLAVLRAFAGFHDPQKRDDDAEIERFLRLVGAVLNVLASALRGHPGNRRAFRYRVDGGGWESLEQALACAGLLGGGVIASGGDTDRDWVYGRLFGILLAFAMDDDGLAKLCLDRWLPSRLCEGAPEQGAGQEEDEKVEEKNKNDLADGYEHISSQEADPASETGDATGPGGGKEEDGKMAKPRDAVSERIVSSSMVAHPEILRTVIGFWVSVPRRVGPGPGAGAGPGPSSASTWVLALILRIASVSVHNRAALYRTGAFSRLIRTVFSTRPEDPVLDPAEAGAALAICRSLATLGLGDPADAQFLLSSPAPAASEFCLALAGEDAAPPAFHFDLSLHGYCAVELGSLGQTFPPPATAPGGGYTFAAWIRVGEFDPAAHTTIFGVYDTTQTCFMLAYLEMDTRNFILQTSVTSVRPSVRFRSVTFEPGLWYHVALVHRRPRGGGAGNTSAGCSRASLYVNGELAEQLKCGYPLPPPPPPPLSPDSKTVSPPTVQAFLGTPRDLSSRVGPGLVRSRWDLASAHLIEDVLSDDMVAVQFGLGPRYQGNFQDRLGGFQTYAASAALGLRSERSAADKSGDKSASSSSSSFDVLTRAIREGAGGVLPEARIAFSVLPTATLREEDAVRDQHGGGNNVLRNLPRSARARLYDLARRTESPLAVNAASPYLPDAVLRAGGVGKLVGHPVVMAAPPSHLDAALWRLGGFTPVALRLVERAATADQTVGAVEIVFRSIQHSWRNSEAMERDSGYAILAMLLRAKLGLSSSSYLSSSSSSSPFAPVVGADEERDRLGLRLLNLVLAFVGYNHQVPSESLIINQLAYRVLLIDLDAWRRLSPPVQQVYYRQFVAFAVDGQHGQFNGRRLQRMRIVKRLLDAFRGELLPEAVLPDFLAAFGALVKFNCSREVMRQLAVFIIYALHSRKTAPAPTPKPTTATTLEPIATNTSTSTTASRLGPLLTRRRFGVRLLGMFADLLCEPGSDRTLILRFAQTVTNRIQCLLTGLQWLLYLLSEDDPEAVAHGCKILARVLVTQGHGYSSKFASRSAGFVVMARKLRRWWDMPTLWPVCLGILFGLDVAEIPFERNFDLFSLVELFAQSKVVLGDALVVVAAMLEHGLRDVLRHQADPDSPVPPPGSTFPPVWPPPPPPQTTNDSLAPPRPRPTTRPRSSSMELSQALEARNLPSGHRDRVAANTGTLQTVTRFLADLYVRSADFRDFALSSDYVRLLLVALYPAVVSADPVAAEVELQARDGTTPLNFDGGDVIIRPLSSASPAPVVRASRVTAVTATAPGRPGVGTQLRKASSFVLLTPSSASVSSESSVSLSAAAGPSLARLKRTATRSNSSNGNTTDTTTTTTATTATTTTTLNRPPANSDVLEGFLELAVAVFVDQLLIRKEFPGFGLAVKIPPGFQEHQAYFESFLLRNTLSRLENELRLDTGLMCEPRVLTNLARLHTHVAETVFEGWFLGGGEVLIDFAGTVLEHLQRPEVAALKSVRLCAAAVATIRACFLKTILLRLSDVSGGDGDGDTGTETDPDGGGGGENDDESDDERQGRQDGDDHDESVALMDKILYWQTALLGSITADDDQMRLLCYQLYARLVSRRRGRRVRRAAAAILRILLVQKPAEWMGLFRRPAAAAAADQSQLVRNFNKLAEVDDDTFLDWVDQSRRGLDLIFFGALSRTWESFVTAENRRTSDASASRASKRRERLRAWQAEHQRDEAALSQHDQAAAVWTRTIYHAEHHKHRRLGQDQRDDLVFAAAAYARMERGLGSSVDQQQQSQRQRQQPPLQHPPPRWRLDQTEGRSRMRLRLLPDYARAGAEEFQPKRQGPYTASSSAPLRLNTAVATSNSNNNTNHGSNRNSASNHTLLPDRPPSSAAISAAQSPFPVGDDDEDAVGIEVDAEDDFEMVPPDPVEADDDQAAAAAAAAASAALDNDDDDAAFEDKNRKVMRRLERGDAVQAAYNVARIVGLEAREGLCIVGREALYIMDDVFQCASGEIVNVRDAPAAERDPFSQIVAGPTARPAPGRPQDNDDDDEQESRSWRWRDVLSLSRRQFLFREVAIEVFFTDGRSYLLAAPSRPVRDELFAKLLGRAPHASPGGGGASLPNPEDTWRLEAVRVADDGSSSSSSASAGAASAGSAIGASAAPGLARLGSIFASSPWNPTLKRWQRGEISNFHYLMLVNTMAGRTFNDLTQYPVFPWVLADYTSEELDLENPATFRDLSRPMGAQTPNRIPGYRENYKMLSEGVGGPGSGPGSGGPVDPDQPLPFHYGTHYSSAMIVASYLIRLPPFVRAFVSLQGGTFDHADRLFQSVPAAWRSASRDSTTDVRELIPEFFCLPDFLTNVNKYNFGSRQNDGGRVDAVELPPWAKGDPTIFIARHRAALESPYVSKHLHRWIDLVFGYRQRGEAAIEALNVFYHLTYRGAADLDSITDPEERAVKAGFIHNFGQTPRQVFVKPHPAREAVQCQVRRLDSAAHTLAALPNNPLLEGVNRVSSLIYAVKLDRLLCADPFRVNFAPYDKFVEWGYADNSVRFYFCDYRRPAGLFEGLHVGQISCVAFADSKTMVTAGEDCVIAVHSVQTAAGKPVEMTLRSSLFGHRTPVRCLAASRAFATLASVSEDGEALLWDLSRLKLIRRLPVPSWSKQWQVQVQCVRINDATGHVMLCSGPVVALYTLNGSLLLEQNVCGAGVDGIEREAEREVEWEVTAKVQQDGAEEEEGGDGWAEDQDENDLVHSCAFYEGAADEWLESFLVFTGHSRGRVRVWRMVISPNGGWALEFVRRLDHVDGNSRPKRNYEAAITCISPMPQCVHTGDEEGRVFEWNLGRRER